MGNKNKRNINAPERGSNVTVDPIRKMKDIKAIIKLLNSNKRDKLLFVAGVNNGLRVCDLLRLKVKDVKNSKIGTTVKIRESKTGKPNIFLINATVKKALKEYLNEKELSDDDYLFKSRQGKKKAITVGTVNKLIKSWVSAINLQGRFGCSSLRKSWGYIQRTKFGVGFEIIAKRFNHSSPAITMRYLGIEDKEVHDSLMNEIC